MQTVSFSEFQNNPNIYDEINVILNDDGIICVPTPSGYKLMAKLQSQKAVLKMIQAKRRVASTPSLILVPDESHVAAIVDDVSNEAETLMKEFWPGPVTLLFSPSDEMNSKVRKALTRAKGWLGVRVPASEVAAKVVKAFGGPLLVSSANLSKKAGAGSVAQVKKNFGRAISLLVDNGDISTDGSSTLVDVTSDNPKIVRDGLVDGDKILSALAG